MAKTYFILDSANNAIKIGKSRNPQERLRALQTAHPRPLQLIGVLEEDCEKRLHRQLKRFHLGGEWFHAHAHLRLLIHRLTVGSLPAPVVSEQSFGNLTLPWFNHVRTLDRAYVKYQKEALSGGMKPEMLCESVGYLPINSVVLVIDHQKHLSYARDKYQEHLFAFYTGAIHDTNGRTARAQIPRLVR